MDLSLENGSKMLLRVGDENCYSFSGNKNTSRMHSHRFAELTLITRGSAKCLYNYTSRTVVKGDMLIIDPNVQHSFQDTNDFACLTLGIEDINFLTNDATFCFKTDANFDFCVAVFKKIMDEAKERDKDYNQIILHLLKTLSIIFARKKITDKAHSNKKTVGGIKINNGIYVAKTDIETYYSRNVTLNGLCEIAYISPQHLIRQFKVLTGFAPKQYLNRVRIQVAAGAILDSFESIKVIARNVGYDDYQAFLYTFKSLVGMNPQKFRDTYKNNSTEGRKLATFFTPDGSHESLAEPLPEKPQNKLTEQK